MGGNAAQMQIVSLNWWQYAGRGWSHANSAQPPNSHLAPKLKINTAHLNNSLHIGGTWYCPSYPILVACVPPPPPLAARRAMTRRGMLLTRVRTLPGRTAAHAWRTAMFSSATVEGRGGKGGGVIHVSDPDWHLIPNMLSWVHVWTPSWPVHDLKILLVQKACRVTCCMGRGIVLDVHKLRPNAPSPMATFDSAGSGCTDAG